MWQQGQQPLSSHQDPSELGEKHGEGYEEQGSVKWDKRESKGEEGKRTEQDAKRHINQSHSVMENVYIFAYTELRSCQLL